MAVKTVYEDALGNKKTGYLIGGKTYQDEQGATPVDVGSVVSTEDGKSWYKGANGSIDVTGKASLLQELRGSGGVNSVAEAYRQQLAQQGQAAQASLKSAQDAQDALIKAKTEAAVSRLQAQVDPLNRGYDAQKKATYRGYVQGQEGLADQMAAAGLGTSGAAESSRVKLTGDYLESQNETELARQNALQSLQQQIEQARLQGDYTAAEQLAGYYQQLASLQQQGATDQANALLTAYQLKTGAEDTAYQRAQDQRTEALQTAQTLAAYGDFSGYRALGYTDAQIAAMKAQYTAENAAKAQTTSGSGTGSAKAYGGLGSYAQTLLGLWQQNKGVNLNTTLSDALSKGLITSQDYYAALQVAGAMGYGAATAADTTEQAPAAAAGKAGYVRGLGGNYTAAQLRTMLASGKIKVTETDGKGNPTNFAWITGASVRPAQAIRRGEQTK